MNYCLSSIFDVLFFIFEVICRYRFFCLCTSTLNILAVAPSLLYRACITAPVLTGCRNFATWKSIGMLPAEILCVSVTSRHVSLQSSNSDRVFVHIQRAYNCVCVYGIFTTFACRTPSLSVDEFVSMIYSISCCPRYSVSTFLTILVHRLSSTEPGTPDLVTKTL